MYKLKEIADKVYYVGVNDRQKALFENMWPLPYGVSYNSYLIVDEKTVLVDTVDVCYSDIFLKKIAGAQGPHVGGPACRAERQPAVGLHILKGSLRNK